LNTITIEILQTGGGKGNDARGTSLKERKKTGSAEGNFYKNLKPGGFVTENGGYSRKDDVFLRAWIL